MAIGLRNIRYFLEVATELHFRRAALRLGIAQPALSRAIKNLESDLDVVLLERTNRAVKLTDAGRRFLEGCQEIVASLEHVVDQTQQVHKGLAGVLRVGYTDFAMDGVFPSLLRRFRKQHPGIIIRPFHDPTINQLRMLDSRELDVGFVTGPINREGLENVIVQSESLVCVVNVEHRLAKRSSIRLEELEDEDFVHGTEDRWKHFYLDLIPLCREAGFEPKIVQVAVTTQGILGLVASGMGVSVLAQSKTFDMMPGIVVVPFAGISKQIKTAAIWKVDELDGPLKLFADFIRDWEQS